MKIAYITGATGCVGRNIVDVLLKDNWDITILHRRSSDLSRLKGLNLKFQEVDLHSKNSVLQAIPEGVSAIFHSAGNTSHWHVEEKEQWTDNVLATRNLVEASLVKKVKRFIFTSTGATTEYESCDEEFSKTIQPSYVRTKRLSEFEIFKGVEKGLDAVILKPIIVIGAYDYNSYSQIFLTLKKSPLQFCFPGRIAFCHAKDVASAHLQAFYRGRCCEHYVLGGDYDSWRNLFEKIAQRMNIKVKIFIAPKWLLRLSSYFFTIISLITRKKPLLSPALVKLLKDCPNVTYDEKRKAELELDYKSSSLDVMIEDCYNWMEKEGKFK